MKKIKQEYLRNTIIYNQENLQTSEVFNSGQIMTY